MHKYKRKNDSCRISIGGIGFVSPGQVITLKHPLHASQERFFDRIEDATAAAPPHAASPTVVALAALSVSLTAALVEAPAEAPPEAPAPAAPPPDPEAPEAQPSEPTIDPDAWDAETQSLAQQALANVGSDVVQSTPAEDEDADGEGLDAEDTATPENPAPGSKKKRRKNRHK